MSHSKIARKVQNLQSSAIRELLETQQNGRGYFAEAFPDPDLFDREGLQIAMDNAFQWLERGVSVRPERGGVRRYVRPFVSY